jgi:predicted glycosyltransferase/glycosyltransferase involved in cell wall biosynthesis
MRIAFYAPLNPPIDGPPSGDRRVAFLLKQALELGGHQVELVSVFRSFDAAGDADRQAQLRDRGGEIADELLTRWRDAPAAERPQLWFTYHLYYKAPDWLGPSVSRALGIAYVIAEASHAPKRAFGRWALGHAACEQAIRQASLLLCPSRDDIAALTSVSDSAQRVTFLPPFLDATPLRIARSARELHRGQLAAHHRIDSDSPWILAVAMMRPGDKLASYRALAQTLAYLKDLRWTLLVAGDGPARAQVEAALAAELAGRTVYLGELAQGDLGAAYAASDLLVWPAVNEAYGMALLEAQAAGLPVVAANSRGVPDVVQDGRTGLLAPPGDNAALAALVRALLTTPERRRAMGCAAADFVAKERGMQLAAEHLTQLLARTQIPPDASVPKEAGSDRERQGAALDFPPPRAFFYVQHLLGIGHLKRAVTLAQALRAGGFDVTLASGGFDVPGIQTEGLRFVQLPAVSAADLSFKSLLDRSGNPVDEQFKRARCEALLAAYQEADPQVLLIELFPFGRRQMRFELLPLLERAASARPRPLIVSSVRDIGGGGQRDPQRLQQTLELVKRYFDLVLVHGDPAVIAFEHSFALAGEIAERIRHTGYVVARSVRMDAELGQGEVLVSAGGGAVGYRLLEAALRARPLSRLNDRIWRMIVGINAPRADTAMIEALAAETGGGRVLVERMRDDFTVLLRNCAVSVSQAGYNTIMEILDAGTRAVVVPFAGGAETEQMLRASVLAQRGYLHVVAEALLAPQTLAAAIDRAAFGPPPPAARVDLNGAAASAQILNQLLLARRQ